MTKKGKAVTKKMYDSCVSQMLLLTGKKRCRLSRDQIGLYIKFGWGADPEKNVQFTEIDNIRGKASNFLRKKHIKDVSKNSYDYDKFLKTIKDFGKSLRESKELMNDKIIKGFLIDKANRNGEIDPKIIIKSYEETYKRISELALEIDFALNSSKTKGRQSLKDLYGYVQELALLYQSLSGKKFTILRNVDGDKCEPVTPGHIFVYKAIEIMNKEAKEDGFESFYSDKNIYNACEEVQKKLKPPR